MGDNITRRPTGAPSSDQDDDDLDAVFIIGMICCALGAFFLLIGIIRLIYYFVLSSKEQDTQREKHRHMQQQKYLREYARTGAASSEYLVVTPTSNSQINGSPRSWTGGSNGAFEWSEISANNTYITEGRVADDGNSTGNRSSAHGHAHGQAHAQTLHVAQNGRPSSLVSNEPKDMIDAVVIDENGIPHNHFGDIQF